MSARPYVTPTRVAELRSLLSPHEWAVLRDVAATRLAQATDLQRLQSLRSPVEVRTFRRLLQRLHDWQVLVRLQRQIGGRRAGSAGYVYGVGIAGQRLLATDGSTQLHRPWTPRPSWLEHALGVSRLYVRLRGAEAQRQLELVEFQAEPEAWRRYGDAPEAQRTLKPDAFVRVEIGDFVDSYFIENDLGTESPATLNLKPRVYADYWQSGVEQERHGVFPRVLWLVPDANRRQIVERVIRRQPEQLRALHRAATYGDAVDVFTEEPP